uniref:MATH domain-containing protein At5g43560 n=2 Tax=Anthurium amnicola TaxID=1678845 RepID=A0A1D1YHT4_9ARAE
MAGSTGEDFGLESGSSSVEGLSSGQGGHSGDSVGEWRSFEQVENGTPSTSPPYWDTDDEDDFGPKPSDLYGKFTWKIENFFQISKRELRSNVFEVGGYKWYILIYPQGCDVCNHLSLFLCVANHDKLLPGWSHFAQFTIAVVNKESKKSKYSDTLHRFWKKEHDWGWKKFMELSKLSDGFIVADALVIKAQVQVIREKSDRPFRCLDCQYRRELVRVYLSNVEQLCRRYVEEKRGKFSKMIEDKVRWSSFRSFWLGVDQNARRWMSREKMEAILKVVVKHFFIEKEVTSTLVMDSLYSGLRAIECQSKFNKGSSKLLEMEEMSMPFVHVEKDMFVLIDDVLLLLERAALGPILPKDEKGSQNQNQNRTKDSSSGEEFTKDSIERDERRLTELGRRTVEIFVLNHIFSSRIEVAYQEAVALKRQEELIREEEAAGQAENEHKFKRIAAEKEKRTKKKQAKQKRNGRKGKERVRDERIDTIVQEKGQEENILGERILDDLSENQALSVLENVGDVSDVSDTVDDVAETLQPDLDERDAGSCNWDARLLESLPVTEAGSNEMQPEQTEKKSPLVMDDSSSTCSTDSIPSVVMNGPYKRNALSSNKSSNSPNRAKNLQSRNTRDRAGQAFGDTNKRQSDCISDASHQREVTVSCKATAAESKSVVLSIRDCTQRLEQHVVEKEEVVTLQKKASSKDQVNEDSGSKPRTAEQSSPPSPIKNPSFSQQPKQTAECSTTAAESVAVREPSSRNESQTEKLISCVSRSPSMSKPEARSIIPAKISTVHQASVSRPPSAPLIAGPRPTVPLVSTAQSLPLLSRSVSATGRLGADTSLSTHSNVLQSYRNAIMCKTTMGASSPNFTPHPSSSCASHAAAHSQSLPAFVPSSTSFPLQKSTRVDPASIRPGLTFGSVNPESLQTRHQWTEEPLEATSSMMHNPNLVSDIQRLDISGTRPRSLYFDEASMRHPPGLPQDDFPHLDIINDLLDEEQSVGKFGSNEYHHSHHPALNRQYTFPCDVSNAADVSASDGSGYYYDDGIHRAYAASNGHFNRRRDLASEQLDLSAYMNGPLESVNRSQWPVGALDHSILGLVSAGADTYPYQLPDSSNLASGLNGYAMYRPASGR